MKAVDIANIRLASQQIAATKFKTVKDMVGWMGAMQAQDFAMSKWAVGVRLPNSTNQLIEAAINNGEIIRTHILRPTWHLVSADDIYWLLDLTAPQIKTASSTRHKQLELSQAVLKKCNTTIEKALQGGNQLTRDELINYLTKANIVTSENRASHIFVNAELSGLLCSGPMKNGKPTFSLLEERVAKTKALTKEEALAKLAGKYFTSHCPATLQDFAWWSGLSARDAKHALEITKSDLVSETVESQTYWLPNSFSVPKNETQTAYLLPAFDEFIISYKDRTASLPFIDQSKAVLNNGIFWPIMVVNGQVVGTWKRGIKKEKVILETEFFNQANKATTGLLEKASRRFGDFLGKQAEINFS